MENGRKFCTSTTAGYVSPSVSHIAAFLTVGLVTQGTGWSSNSCPRESEDLEQGLWWLVRARITITLIANKCSYRWSGEIDGRKGLFPASYVKALWSVLFYLPSLSSFTQTSGFSSMHIYSSRSERKQLCLLYINVRSTKLRKTPRLLFKIEQRNIAFKYVRRSCGVKECWYNNKGIRKGKVIKNERKN